MIVEVCGLGSDRKEEGKGFMSANQTTSFTSSGRGPCLPFKGKRPKSSEFSVFVCECYLSGWYN